MFRVLKLACFFWFHGIRIALGMELFITLREQMSRVGYGSTGQYGLNAGRVKSLMGRTPINTIIASPLQHRHYDRQLQQQQQQSERVGCPNVEPLTHNFPMSPDERGDKRHGQERKADEERHGEPHPADVHQRVVGPIHTTSLTAAQQFAWARQKQGQLLTLQQYTYGGRSAGGGNDNRVVWHVRACTLAGHQARISGGITAVTQSFHAVYLIV